MTAVGLFAGRGDTILAMGLALLVGVWAGWQLRNLWQWFVDRRAAKQRDN